MKIIFAFGLIIGANALKCHQCYQAVDQLNNTMGSGDAGCFAGDFEDETVCRFSKKSKISITFDMKILLRQKFDIFNVSKNFPLVPYFCNQGGFLIPCGPHI